MRKAVYVGLALTLCVLALVGCSSPTAPAEPVGELNPFEAYCMTPKLVLPTKPCPKNIGRDSAITGPFLPVPVVVP